MRVWLIRHGMTRLGEEHRYQGSLDEGLTAAGKSALRRAELQPDHVYVSPALRARETALILFPEAVQICCQDLREMDFGAFEGRGWWEMETDPVYRAWVEGNCRGRCPEGEDRESFSARVLTAYEKLAERERVREGEHADGHDVFVVAHGGTQMALLEHLGRPEREYYQWQRPCGCGWLLEEMDDRTLKVLREISFVR